MADARFSLGGKASEVYSSLAVNRQAVVDTAREMAELTIPSIFPPEHYKPGDPLPGNHQSVGARCVNNLASRLMFQAFPPGRPMLRFEPVEHKLGDDIASDPAMWSKVKLALSRKEMEHRRRAETTNLRTAYAGFVAQLLVSGNCLWHHDELDAPRWHRCDSYVVKRNARGSPLLSILEEEVSVQSLAEDVRDLIYDQKPDLADQPEWEQKATIHTVCKLHVEGDAKRWLYWQEFEGEMIPETDVETEFDNPPMYPHWLIPVYGEDWGRSYCEEYRGDLYTIETSAAALNDGAAIASLLLLFVKPGSRTSAKQLKEAQNLSVFTGDAEADISTLRIDKGGDFQFVSNNAQEAAKRLGFAFLLNSAIQRPGERVTAEEWRRLGAELDQAMGGLYTQLAQTPQRLIVVRFVRLHEEEDSSLPELPEDLVRIAVVTGLDAMGSTTEEESLTSFVGTLSQIFGPQALGMIDASDFARRLAAEKGLQPEGLVKDAKRMAEEAAAAEQQAAQRTVLEKGVAPAVTQLGAGLRQSQEQPQEQ